MNVASPMPFAGIRRPNPATFSNESSVSLITLLSAFNVFIVYSRIPELLAAFFNINFRLVIIVGGLCLVGLALQGWLITGVRSIQGKMFIFLTFWMALSGLFGIWRGGSFDLFVNVWLKSVLLFFLITGSVNTKKDLRVMLNALALSVVFIVFEGIVLGNSDSERGAVTMAGVKGLTFSNANGLAMALGLGIPFLLFQVSISKSILLRFFSLVITCLACGLILRTGSRGGVLALLLMLAMIFFRAGVLQKSIMLLALILVASIGLGFVPKAALERYISVFGRIQSGEARSAEESRLQRIVLLKESIAITFYHPLFGVGPGNFISASAKDAEEKGHQAAWLETHNSYTRVSSETGIPGFLMFSGILFSSMFKVRALWKRTSALGDEYFANACFYAFVSLSVYSLISLFDSSAFQFQLPMLSGVAVAMLTVAGNTQSTKVFFNPAIVPDRFKRSRIPPPRMFNAGNSLIGSKGGLPQHANHTSRLSPLPRRQ